MSQLEDWDRRATPGMVLVRGRDPEDAPSTGEEVSVTLPPALPPLTMLLFNPSLELMVLAAPSGPSSGVEGSRDAFASGMAVGVVIGLLSAASK